MPSKAPKVRNIPCVREVIAQTKSGTVVANVPKANWWQWKLAQLELESKA